MESLNVKSGPNVIAGLKCRCKIIQETQTRVTSTIKAEQEGNSYIPGGFSTNIILMLILQAMCVIQSPLFPMLMCKLL